jgi:hypothetical protein
VFRKLVAIHKPVNNSVYVLAGSRIFNFE